MLNALFPHLIILRLLEIPYFIPPESTGLPEFRVFYSCGSDFSLFVVFSLSRSRIKCKVTGFPTLRGEDSCFGKVCNLHSRLFIKTIIIQNVYIYVIFHYSYLCSCASVMHSSQERPLDLLILMNNISECTFNFFIYVYCEI